MILRISGQNKHKQMQNKFKIFQIYYKEEHKEKLCDNFIPYFNQKKSIFVENQCFIDIFQKKLIEDADYVGAFSYKFHDKVIHNPTYEDMVKIIESHTDIDIFSPRLRNYTIVSSPRDNFPKRLVFDRLDKFRKFTFPNQMDMETKALPLLRDMASQGIIKEESISLWGESYYRSVFCNFWIAKKDVFVDYVDFLIKTISLIESYEKDNWLFTTDKTYPYAPPEDWASETQFKNYPIVTFILERMINLYILDRQLNHKNCL